MEVFMSILLMLGGVGVFIAGMKQMSVGIEQSAGQGVRSMFKKISSNKYAGYGFGIGTTAIVQSSSATSIMTIGLANANIVNHHQGSAIILGAKVGTTLTAFIFAMSGLSKGAFSAGVLFSSMAFVGIITSMVTSKEYLRKFALFLTGFGMLFFGLEAMGMVIGGSETALGEAIEKLFQYDYMKNPVLLVLIGVLFTCIIQSSTAATGVFIKLLQTGVLSSIDQSFFLVMGANIGTCMDGIMASFGSNTNGKRLALFHTMTSTMGAIFFSIILVIFRSGITNMFNSLFAKPEWSLVVFNLSYNTIYTVVLLFMLSPLVVLTEKLIKDKNVETKKSLKYLDERLLLTPAIAMAQVKKEVLNMARLASENLDVAFNALVNKDKTHFDAVEEKEKTIDNLNQEIADFLIQYSSVTQNKKDELIIGTTHHIINDIERIGDHAHNFMQLAVSVTNSEESFSEESITELKSLYEKVKNSFELGLNIYEFRNYNKLQDVASIENEIDKMYKEYASKHITRLNNGISKLEVQFYYDIISELERIGDHIINIAFSIQNPTGKQYKKPKQTSQVKELTKN